MYQQWGNLTLECKICEQLTNSCLNVEIENWIIIFYISTFFPQVEEGCPPWPDDSELLHPAAGDPQEQQELCQEHSGSAPWWSELRKKIQFRLFKSTSNPNCLGDVRSLPRRRQRLWRTSCWWEVLRSWEGETQLHFEQITILINQLNHCDVKAEPIWFKSVSPHFQPKWSIGGYPHVVGRVIRGHRFIETY